MQQRNNYRAQPTLELRNVRLRSVSEAYEDVPCQDRHINQKIINVIKIFFIIVIIAYFVLALLTYPPSIEGLMIELFAGLLFGYTLHFLYIYSKKV